MSFSSRCFNTPAVKAVWVPPPWHAIAIFVLVIDYLHRISGYVTPDAWRVIDFAGLSCPGGDAGSRLVI
jgi:hypothetical protein